MTNLIKQPLLILLCLALCCLTLYSSSSLASSNINNLKAAFIYQFAKYTKWPKFESNIITFCSLEHQEINQALSKLTDKKVKQQQVKVIILSDINEAVTLCQVLFIDSSNQNDIDKIFAISPNAPILTIGEGKDFINQGGMITLIQQGLRQRFMINTKRTSTAQLKLSSKLLQLAIPLASND
jgi:hypothetical protein